jgi:hypothetical protein
MDDLNNTTTGTRDQADEDILTYTVSDEALEAAAGTECDTSASSLASACHSAYPPLALDLFKLTDASSSRPPNSVAAALSKPETVANALTEIEAEQQSVVH